jgi:hypothetical protein
MRGRLTRTHTHINTHTHTRKHTHTHTHTHNMLMCGPLFHQRVCVYVYVYVCLCVRVHGVRVRVRVRVCLCLFLFLFLCLYVQCLSHPYLSEYHDPEDEPTSAEVFEWDFEHRDLTKDEVETKPYTLHPSLQRLEPEA